jgi:hypothetical protein
MQQAAVRLLSACRRAQNKMLPARKDGSQCFRGATFLRLALAGAGLDESMDSAL